MNTVQHPLVSIVVPIYGVGKYISRCAHSLFNQTYDNIEYVFVNDCTKDNSMEILHDIIEEYPERKQKLKIINHEVNQGLAAARCTGIANATGDYIMHADSDDYLEVRAVESLLESACSENADIVIGGFNSVCDESTDNVHIPEHLDVKTYILRILNASIRTNVWAKLYSSALYGEGKDTRPVPGINHGEDYVTLPRLLYYAKKISYVDEPVYNYRQDNSASFTNNFSLKSMQDIVKANDVLQSFFDGKYSREELDTALLRSQLSMYKYCKIELYDKIKALYPQVYLSCRKNVSLPDRILLFLVDHGMKRLAVLYIRTGLKLLNYVR